MTRKNKRIIQILVSCLLFVVVALVLSAWFLIDYALKPGNRSRNEAQAWKEVFFSYPNTKPWRDSLVVTHTLRDTFITDDKGMKMHAWYVRAPQPTAATALLVHGYTNCGIRMMPLGCMYNHELGMNILLPDLKNAGRSDGDHFQMGWFDRCDVKRWANVCSSLFGDSVRIVVHGVSMGAATTMMLSGDDDVPSSVKLYVEDCGYTSVEDQFAKELKERFHLPRFPIIPLASALCKLRYGWSFSEASSLAQVKRCNKPMLFIHGANDDFVPTAMVYPLYRAKPADKTLWVVNGAAHARSYKIATQRYTEKVDSFLCVHHFVY